ncbi:MAG TPA: alanine racemase [Candidatus Binatia bacterium]|nr:alanine racemase [Candidatus Binatia bacterium]
MPIVDSAARRLTQAFIHLDHLAHNLRLLQRQAAPAAVWPVIKANAYGHDAAMVAAQLVRLGCQTLCVADVEEAIALIDAGSSATFIILSATLPRHSETLVAYDCQPVVCTLEMVEALATAARKLAKRISVHVKVDTGMGRLGIPPEEVTAFLDRCRDFPAIDVRGLMSHFPRADEADKSYSIAQLAHFRQVVELTQSYGIKTVHMANSAAIFALPDSHFDAVRPGIALYGLQPAAPIAHPTARELKPVLELKSQVIFLKEVAPGTGLSYGHAFHTQCPSLIATLPIGYGDGLSRNLSGRIDVLVRGVRCPQVGRITMDLSLIDVTALRGQVELGDEAVIIGRQGTAELSAEELASKLGTINYEIVTGISHRVPRVASENNAQ